MMLTPNENWFQLNDIDEKIRFYKLCGLMPLTADYIKTIYYTGIYTKEPVICDIVGVTSTGNAVLKIGSELHCILPEYLRQMQPTQSIPIEYVVFDLETTGLSRTDNILEIGAIKIKNDNIIDTFDQLINPKRPIPTSASHVNHITDDMVSECPTISDVLPQFLDFIGKLPLVAHNAPFDVSFIKRYSTSLKNQIFDTVKMSRKAFPELKSHSLQSLIKDLNIVVTSSHRSLPDAQATAKLFQICYKQLYPTVMIKSEL